jgi:hypothetical protein
MSSRSSRNYHHYITSPPSSTSLSSNSSTFLPSTSSLTSSSSSSTSPPPSSPSLSSPSLSENAPVSSKGCSRSFIVIFLYEALHYCRTLSHSPDFPFTKSLIKIWLNKAQIECHSRTISSETLSPYGGIEFKYENSSSYWTSPKQFYTWWKNNIERKNKFANLERDAEMASNEKTLLR